MSVPNVSDSAERIVVFGMPEAGKSSLLGALAQTGISQVASLGGQINDHGSLSTLRHQLYEDRTSETQEEIVTYPVQLIGNGPKQPGREAVVIDCDGRAANAILTHAKPLNQSPNARKLSEAILTADSLVFVVDAGSPPDLRDKDFREFAKFLKRFEELRAREHVVGGLPVFLVLSKCDKLAHPQMNASEWQQAIADHCHEAARRFREVLDEDPTGADGYWKFGSLDFHVSPCSVKRPRLVDMAAQPQEPYGVAELFREVFADASDFRQRTEKSSNLLSWIIAGVTGLLGTLAVSGSLLFINPVGDVLPANGLSAQVDRLQASEGQGAPARLASTVLEKRLKLYQDIQNDPEFDRLTELQKSYIRLRIDEAQAYLKFREELSEVPPLARCRSLAELAEIEKRIGKTAVPAVYHSEWTGTDAVLLRERILTKDIPQLRAAVSALTNHFHSLKNRGSALLLESSELTSDWERKGRELTEEAEKTKPFAKADPKLGPAYLFDDVSFAEADWLKLGLRLANVRDLAQALGLLGNNPTTAPLTPEEHKTSEEALSSAQRRLLALRKMYPDSKRWLLADMPDAALPEIQKRLKRSAEELIRDGHRIILARSKNLNGSESENTANWPLIGAYIQSNPEVQDWRELTDFVTGLYDPTKPELVEMTAKFLRETSFDFEFKRVSVKIPDTLSDQLVRPVGDLTIGFGKNPTDADWKKVTLQLEGEPKREKQHLVYSFVVTGNPSLRSEIGRLVIAELSLKKMDNSELKLTWNKSRTKAFQFEALHTAPRLHDPKSTVERGSPAEGVLLSVTEGKFTPVPLLLPAMK